MGTSFPDYKTIFYNGSHLFDFLLYFIQATLDVWVLKQTNRADKTCYNKTMHK